MSSLEKCLFGSPAHLLIGCMFFCVEMYEFFMFSGYYPLNEFVICKYLLPFNRLPFHFKDSFLHLQKLVWCSFRLVWCRATSLSLFTFMHWRRKWQPTPVFLPGESQGWGAWWTAVYGVAQSRTRLKRLSSSSSNPICSFLHLFP